MTSWEISEGPDRTRGQIGPELGKEQTAYATAQRWEEGEVVRVAGWKSSQKEVGTEPGKVRERGLSAVGLAGRGGRWGAMKRVKPWSQGEFSPTGSLRGERMPKRGN